MDVTRLSSREIPPGTLAERAPSEPLIGWWWGVWLLSGVAGQISSRLFFDAQTNSEWTAAYTSDVISQPIGAVSAVLAIRVVSLVAARQQERLRSPDPGPSEMGLNL
ncbi:MAG TPA: DUF4328 domain-containing protein [Actinomycetes bacterium]|nr:DUF4328 domain-containing protein [Actinomycetes bacterium]